MKYIKIISFILLLTFNHLQGLAQSCPASLQINYPDGEKGCLTELPIAKLVDAKWGKSIEDVAKHSGYYVIASSSSCNVASIGAANSSLTSGAKSISAAIAVSNCPRNCDCTSVIENGRVLLPKRLVSLLGTDRTILAVNPSNKSEASSKTESTSSTNISTINQKILVASESANKTTQYAENDRLERQKDRELLLELSAELVRLRAESESLKNAQQNQQVAISSIKTEAPLTLSIFANRKALVIGNDGYKFVSKLSNAKQDATSIAENLTKVGYKVTLKLDQSEKEMKATLRGFKAQVESGDEVAIFFAGHGVQLSNTNYLIPIDVAGEGEEQVKDEAIALQRILDDMADKKVKFTLAMIDACRDNPFKSNGRSIGNNSRGLAPTTAATGQMVVFSAGSGQQALDKLGPNDKDKNGLFTRVFIKEMQKSGVTIDQLVRNVRNEVVTTAKSIGHDQVPAIYDQVVGEFYFRK